MHEVSLETEREALALAMIGFNVILQRRLVLVDFVAAGAGHGQAAVDIVLVALEVSGQNPTVAFFAIIFST